MIRMSVEPRRPKAELDTTAPPVLRLPRGRGPLAGHQGPGQEPDPDLGAGQAADRRARPAWAGSSSATRSAANSSSSAPPTPSPRSRAWCSTARPPPTGFHRHPRAGRLRRGLLRRLPGRVRGSPAVRGPRPGPRTPGPTPGDGLPQPPRPPPPGRFRLQDHGFTTIATLTTRSLFTERGPRADAHRAGSIAWL